MRGVGVLWFPHPHLRWATSQRLLVRLRSQKGLSGRKGAILVAGCRIRREGDAATELMEGRARRLFYLINIAIWGKKREEELCKISISSFLTF